MSEINLRLAPRSDYAGSALAPIGLPSSAEGAAVGLPADAGGALEAVAEGGGRAELDLAADAFDRVIGGFQQVPRLPDARATAAGVPV